MTSGSEFSIRVDPTNPGQFFACCGLLELASRCWAEVVEAWFEDDGRLFRIRIAGISLEDPRALLSDYVRSCTLKNTMTSDECRRRDQLAIMTKKEIEAAGRKAEEGDLASLWRESPVLFGPPFNLTIDWHLDTRAGGSTFKTWAGQQSVIDIALGMQALMTPGGKRVVPNDEWLCLSSRGGGLPFNFDSDLGGQGSPLDVGFSFDPLADMSIGIRPIIELCAFVGLQRFRPARMSRENRYRYTAWNEPLPTSIASVAAAGLLDLPATRQLEFRLLYRTKYLKSFLSAKPV
jgi:CRISPR-associated protein Csb3